MEVCSLVPTCFQDFLPTSRLSTMYCVMAAPPSLSGTFHRSSIDPSDFHSTAAGPRGGDGLSKIYNIVKIYDIVKLYDIVKIDLIYNIIYNIAKIYMIYNTIYNIVKIYLCVNVSRLSTAESLCLSMLPCAEMML
jgi:hypothetical protein